MLCGSVHYFIGVNYPLIRIFGADGLFEHDLTTTGLSRSPSCLP